MSVFSFIVRGLGFLIVSPIISVALQLFCSAIGLTDISQAVKYICNISCNVIGFIISYFVFFNPHAAKKENSLSDNNACAGGNASSDYLQSQTLRRKKMTKLKRP